MRSFPGLCLSALAFYLHGSICSCLPGACSEGERFRAKQKHLPSIGSRSGTQLCMLVVRGCSPDERYPGTPKTTRGADRPDGDTLPAGVCLSALRWSWLSQPLVHRWRETGTSRRSTGFMVSVLKRTWDLTPINEPVVSFWIGYIRRRGCVIHSGVTGLDVETTR